MKKWTALAGALVVVQLCFGALQALNPDGLTSSPSHNGRAYITQAGSIAATKDLELAFGDTWDSVRTFRLVRPLNAPIRVYIETQPRNASLYKPHYDGYVKSAFESWSRALDGRLTFVQVNSRKAADITFDWVPGFDDHYVAGITTYSIGHATVEIKTVGIPDKDIKGNIIHELGHALGIAGHSQDPGDIMVGVRRWHRNDPHYEPQLSSRDVQAIRRLYSANWHQGEDLYSKIAQTVPVQIIPVANTSVTTPAQQAQALQPATDITHLASDTSSLPKQGQRILAPRYVQVLNPSKP